MVGAGALVLLVFLFGVSFTSRFAGLSAVQRGMYLTSAVLSAVSAVLLLVPAAYPGLLPGHRPGGQVSRAVTGAAAGGLATAGLAVSAAVRVAARWAGSALAADLLGAGTAALFAIAWFVFPWLLSRGQPAACRRSGTHPAQRRRLARARHGRGFPAPCGLTGRPAGMQPGGSAVLAVGHQLAVGAANQEGWLQAGELGVALLLSAVIGLEREMRQKNAGLRTHTLGEWVPRCSC